MTLTVGRASFDRCPSSATQTGNSVTFVVEIRSPSLGEAKAVRQQVLGLADNSDEPVVPVTWTDDSDYDGFYRVRGVSVDPVSGYLARNRLLCSIDLERVGGGYAQPATEISWIAANIDYDRYVVETTRIGVPDSVVWQTVGNAGNPVRSTSTGDVQVIDVVADADGNGAPSVADGQFGVLAADFYQGAATIEMLRGGIWTPVAGRQIPSSTTGYRLGNGLIRLWWKPSGDIELEVFDGTGWDAVGTFQLFAGSAQVEPVGLPSVIRNAPNAVTLQFATAPGPSINTSQTTTITVRRGQLFASIAWLTPTSGSPKIGTTTSIASTGIADTDTGSTHLGCYQTSNGATGHQFVIGTSQPTSTSANGSINITPVSSTKAVPCMIGVALNGTSAATADTVTNVFKQWWAQVAEQQLVVSR